MAYQAVNVGTVADDHTGDPGRTAFQKVNANFTELYARPSILASGALPMFMPSSGTFTAGGALSAITAFNATYESCFLYFPANAVATSSAAGFYYAVMSSTTAGTVYLNAYSSGTPTVPTTLIPCTTASSYTQTTGSLVTAITVTVPANSLGGNGKVRVPVCFQNNNSAGTKTIQANFGGTAFFSSSNTTSQTFNINRDITNRGLTNSQVTMPLGNSQSLGATVNPTLILSKDTTVAVDVTIQIQLGTATDWVGVDFFSVELTPQT